MILKLGKNKNNLRKLIIITAVFFIFNCQLTIINSALAQQAGTSYITNFTTDIYKAHAQNWSIVQDKRGIIFFGNTFGVLEYDGITWRLLKTTSFVRSLAIDSIGRILVGLKGDFGYLYPDSLGTYQYRSLKEKIPLQHREFNDVWKIYVLGNRIFFQTLEKIFILQNEKIKVVYPKEKFHLSFLVNHSFYVREQGQGLMTYNNDSLQLIAGGELFSDEKIYIMLPYRQDEILIVSRTKGVWIYSPRQSIKFYKPAGFETVDKFLIQYFGYCGTVLENGCFALGTITGGIIVFNTGGKIQTIYSTGTGLQDNTIHSLYSDNNKQLWAALGNGISLVQSNLPFQCFTEMSGLKGSPLCIDYFSHHLYVGTSQYLCLQNPDGSFETINGTDGQNWQLIKVKNAVLLANAYGLFEIKEKQAVSIIKSDGFLSLCSLNNKPDYLLAGFSTPSSGLCLLEYNQKTWKIKNTVKGFNKNSYKIVQDKDGCIWVGTNPELWRLKLNETMDTAISVMQCTTQQGLPTNKAEPYLLNSGEVVFGSEKGIYGYNSANHTFERHPDFKMLAGTISPFQQQKNGDIWFQEFMGNDIYEIGLLKFNKGNYRLFKQPFYKFNNYSIDGFYDFYISSESSVFIGTNKGLLQYNPIQKVDYNQSFHTLIRKVFAKETLLFGGTTADAEDFENPKGAVIPYRENNLVFHYAATFYEDADKNLYSYRLIGSDTAWSEWVSDVKKEYTTLNEGIYTFEVKSKNQYNKIGSTATFSFRILPPWQRTWWAHALYAMLFAGFVIVIVRFFTRRLVRQKKHLEQVVNERTHEIMEKNEELKQQREGLFKLNADKDRFISILGHDLKSPFTALLGLSEILKDNIQEINADEIKKMAGDINKTAQNTFNLLEDLLKWARSQQGKIPFKPQNIGLDDICKAATEVLNPSANAKNIKINYNVADGIIIFADIDMLKTVLRNLVSNAIKFTANNGMIDIYAKQNSENITITVSDNGVGIPSDNLAKLFDVGQVLTTKGTAEEKGTGLGLLLCKEFVEKHGGRIWVESEAGKGSNFIFTLPLFTEAENQVNN
jgi:signal transduction histidine kinase/ligand-binding sensor domain-containing protein